MASDADGPEDVAALMEALWGPRADAEADVSVLADAERRRTSGTNGADPAAATMREPAPEVAEPAGVGPDTVLAYVDAALTDQLALVRAELMAAVASEVARTTETEASARSDSLEKLREDAVAVADARIAGAEARLLGRLDGIAAALALSADRGNVADSVLARLDAVEGEGVARLSVLEDLVLPQLQDLVIVVDRIQAASATTVDLELLRTEVVNLVADQVDRQRAGTIADVLSAMKEEVLTKDDLAAAATELQAAVEAVRVDALQAADERAAIVGKEMEQHIEGLTGQVEEVRALAASGDVAVSRIDAVEVARLGESLAAHRAELAGLLSALEAGLVQWAAEWRSEVELRLDGLASQIGALEVASVRRLVGRRKRRNAEIVRLAESVAAAQAQREGDAEFAALRSDLEKQLARGMAQSQAEVDRRFAVLDAVSADSEAEAAADAPLRRDLRALQEEVRDLTVVVSELQQQMSSPLRKPSSTAAKRPSSTRKGKAAPT